MAPWKLPVVVLAIVVPVAVGFFAGGPGAGVGVAALVAVAIVVVAVRERPGGAIGEAPAGADRNRLLVVVSSAVEDPLASRSRMSETQMRWTLPISLLSLFSGSSSLAGQTRRMSIAA